MRVDSVEVNVEVARQLRHQLLVEAEGVLERGGQPPYQVAAASHCPRRVNACTCAPVLAAVYLRIP